MTDLPVEKQCPVLRACQWSQHGRKHFPFKGMTRSDTVNEPALYRPGMKPGDIRALEGETVRIGKRMGRSPAHSEYVRKVDEVIGWDEGRDATLSFAECSGGTNVSRTSHGRPMSTENRKAAGR